MAARAPAFVADALWHTLCPSFSRSLRNCQPQRCARQAQLRRHVRCIGHAATVPTWGESAPQESQTRVTHVTEKTDSGIPAWAGQPHHQLTREDREEQNFSNPTNIPSEPARHYGDSTFSEQLATPLLARLEEEATVAKKLRVQKTVVRLVKDLGMNPDARIYKALLLAEADPWHGSAAEVERLLSQVDLDGIPMDSATYHAALKALAIHPNYILRERLLGEMERRWIELNESGWHYVTAALFRERQIELGLERLSSVRERGYAPPTWLLHLAISTCLSIEAFPEALALLKHRATYRDPVPSAIWSLALTTAAHAHSHPMVDYVWRRAVELSYLNPSSGTCTAVLDTVALHGNYRLASDVFRVLGARNTPLQAYHYEALLESYLTAGDLASAVAVLQLMARDPSVSVDDGAIRALVHFLADDASHRVPHCLALLTDASARPAMPKPKNQRQDWNLRTWEPAPVLGACIEALARVGALDAAWQVYWSWDAYHGAPAQSGVGLEETGTTPNLSDESVNIPPPSYSVYSALLLALAKLPAEHGLKRKDELHADARRRGYRFSNTGLLRSEEDNAHEKGTVDAI